MLNPRKNGTSTQRSKGFPILPISFRSIDHSHMGWLKSRYCESGLLTMPIKKSISLGLMAQLYFKLDYLLRGVVGFCI